MRALFALVWAIEACLLREIEEVRSLSMCLTPRHSALRTLTNRGPQFGWRSDTGQLRAAHIPWEERYYCETQKNNSLKAHADVI